MKDITDIHIALAFDQNFLTPFYVLLTSIFCNNRENRIFFHVIATGINIEQKEKIIDYIQFNNSQIEFYTINKEYDIEKFNTQNLKSNSFTIAIFYRLFFPVVVSENIKKLLYLDVDTVVLGDLKPLYLTNIFPYPIGASSDAGMLCSDYSDVLDKIGVSKENYFNSGVLLIDIIKWKEENIFEKVFRFLIDNYSILKYMDQDALNYVLKNNWFKFSNLYNFCHPDISIDLTKKEILKNKITIIHYTASKPWHFTNNARLRRFYYYYLKKTPFIAKKKYVDLNWTIQSLKIFANNRAFEYYLDNKWIRNLRKKLKPKIY